MAFNQRAYEAEFHKAAYDKIVFVVPKGRRQEIKACAESHGVSMAKLIINALETTYKLDLSKK